MVFGTVAENINVRRCAGAAPSISSSSSRNPIFSISSASSRTTALSMLRSREPRLIWSHRRPGVPTTICAPRPRALRSVRISMPPTHVASRAPVSLYSHSSSRFTCKASSRVGAITTAKGACVGAKLLFSPSKVGARAKPKATVLPEPVCAETNRSAVSSLGAITAS